MYLGLDLGCCWAKGAAVDAAGRQLWHGACLTGTDERAAGQLLRARLTEQRPGPVADGAVATGAGRHRAGPDLQRRTEVSCLARAAFHLFPRALDVLDVGGRGCTAVQVAGTGRVVHFRQQRQCGAGTGFFLDELARRLGLEPQRMEALAAAGAPTARLQAQCGMFAVAEAAERVRAGAPLADLCRAALLAVAERLTEHGPLGPFVVLSGGVVERFPMLGSLLAQACDARVEVPPQPGAFGALGAALIACDSAMDHPRS